MVEALRRVAEVLVACGTVGLCSSCAAALAALAASALAAAAAALASACVHLRLHPPPPPPPSPPPPPPLLRRRRRRRRPRRPAAASSRSSSPYACRSTWFGFGLGLGLGARVRARVRVRVRVEVMGTACRSTLAPPPPPSCTSAGRCATMRRVPGAACLAARTLVALRLRRGRRRPPCAPSRVIASLDEGDQRAYGLAQRTARLVRVRVRVRVRSLGG